MPNMFFFYISIFFVVIFAQTDLKAHVYFYFLFRYTICIDFIFNRRTFGILRIFCESFSMGSLLNQSQTYQGNPCDVYLDLSSLSGSGIIQNPVNCIKQSAPSKDHISMSLSLSSTLIISM